MWQQINPYIRRAWYNTLHPGEEIKERSLFDYEILFVKEGRATVTIQDVAIDARSGDLFIFRPRIPHSIIVDPDCSMVQPHVHFDLIQYPDAQQVPVSYWALEEMSEIEKGYFRPDLLTTILTPCPSHIRLKNPQYIEFLLADVIYTHAHRTEYSELNEKSLFLKLLYQVLVEIKMDTDTLHVEKGQYAAQIRQYLEQNIHRNVPLDELTRIHNLSKSHLLSLFRAAYQTTPLRFHQVLRMNKAKYLLRFTTAPISEIGGHVGIPDIHEFSRTFKRVVGVPPSRYRASDDQLEMDEGKSL